MGVRCGGMFCQKLMSGWQCLQRHRRLGSLQHMEWKQAEQLSGHVPGVRGFQRVPVSCCMTNTLDLKAAKMSGKDLQPIKSLAAGKGKALVYAGVPADMIKQIKAGDWLKSALEVMGGKGGGKPTAAQGQGPDIAKLSEALEAAARFASSKLGEMPG